MRPARCDEHRSSVAIKAFRNTHMIKNKSLPPTRLSHEVLLTWTALIFSGFACIMLCKDLLARLVELLQRYAWTEGLVQVIFIIVVGFLLFGNFVYQIARIGRLRRTADHCPMSRQEMETLYTRDASRLSVLVPSYKENPKIIRKTLLSAALLDYPSKYVILLIDNEPNPTGTEDRHLLNATRTLPREIKDLLNAPASRLRGELNRFLERAHHGQLDVVAELENVALLYESCADWLDRQADDFATENHEDRWFVFNILRVPAQQHRERALKMRAAAQNPAAGQRTSISLEYHRLSRLFQAELTCFERKKYVNLSHESNKAMNLNSYLGLMGHGIREIRKENGLHLVTVEPHRGNNFIPDADFVITLDADSLLKSDYALRLVALMEQRVNESLAVAQTPYSAFPEAPNALERTAGATTDIQFLVHQGFTYFNATFWVGANALLRKKALEDIVVVGEERGYEIRRYIQDRTVIEDTESSVDLVLHGWRLFNYPERLAYSATPPDFGSLLIQRRRWANGGLIILPKLLRYLSGPKVPHRIGHTVMGIHYLTSLATVNFGILLLLALPIEEPMKTLWLPLATLPYFLLYARDLWQIGYRLGDFFRVSAMSLLLVPVNLGGVCKSIQQMVLKQRTPFGRTPKVASRTVTPLFYLSATYGFLVFCLFSFALSVQAGHYLHATFAGTNAALLAYGILRFIGLRETYEDIRAGYASILPPEPVITGTPDNVRDPAYIPVDDRAIG